MIKAGNSIRLKWVKDSCLKIDILLSRCPLFQLHDNQVSNVESVAASSNGTISSTMTSTASLSQANTQCSQDFQQQQQQFYSPGDMNSTQSHMMNLLQQQNSLGTNSNSKIPDIVLTGKCGFEEIVLA